MSVRTEYDCTTDVLVMLGNTSMRVLQTGSNGIVGAYIF